jgi:hypothetical protein
LKAALTHDRLAHALLDAVLAQDFDQTPDRMQRGGAVADFPSLDLAVVGFPPEGAPVWANVLFSREMPGGWVGDIGLQGELPVNVRYVADITDSQTVSVAWQPGADWARMDFPPLAGEFGVRFVAPYPASLLKVMVALGVGLAMDAGLCTQQEVQGPGRAMLVDSDNDATTLLVKRLHDWGLIRRGGDGLETHNALHTLFAQRGLGSLRLARTALDGGWGNAAGSGVGHIQMTAWDTARLLWLLDPQAPPAPWPGAAPLVSARSRDWILRWMGEHSPNRILFRDEAASGLHFTHKTGTTANYGSDAGIVRARPPGRRHYLVALLSNLGSRYGPPEAEFDVSPKLSGLGLAVDAIMRRFLEPDRATP